MISLKSVVSAVVAFTIVAGFAVSSSFAARAKKAAVSDKGGNQAKVAVSVTENIIDAFEAVQGWESYTDNTAKVSFTVVPGKVGKAMEADYDFGTGGWVAFGKPNDKDFSKVKGIKFWFKGAGSMNTVEMKLQDDDGSEYGVLTAVKSNNKEWVLVEVPFSQFTYWWGGNQELNWTKIVKVHLGISRKDGDEGGAGKATFDQLELMK